MRLAKPLSPGASPSARVTLAASVRTRPHTLAISPALAIAAASHTLEEAGCACGGSEEASEGASKEESEEDEEGDSGQPTDGTADAGVAFNSEVPSARVCGGVWW